jgi:predicted Fe-S protein YdhL (DUF1289 family)
MSKKEIPSPCISVCRYDNEVCVGCDRTVDEVVGWYDMTDDEKQAVLNRLDEKNRGSFSDWI